MHRILKTILHLFFWLTYGLFAGLISFRLSEGFGYMLQHWLFFGINAGWAAIAFYLNYFFFFFYIQQKKYLLYFITALALSVAITVLFYLVYNFLVFPTGVSIPFMEIVPSMVGTFIISCCGSLLRGFIAWFDDSGRKAELEKQNLRTELELLRAQLNHHFLFNTLNNIDTLIFKDAQRASDALIALSSILRYMLYDTKTETVPLKNEIEHIRNIIHLEQLRIPVEGYTEVSVAGDSNVLMVPPLLFVPFVENAYKYAVFKGKLPAIRIQFGCDAHKLVFSCINTFNPDSQLTTATGNMGIENIQRRLWLIYNQNYKLEINKNEDTFTVLLEIPC